MSHERIAQSCVIVVVIGVLLMAGHLANAAPSYGSELDNIQEVLYQLLRNEMMLAERPVPHQMVRKAGRDPAVRLRFGRRADPFWQSADFSNEVSAENSNN